jgi:hypothetical protein
MVNWHNPRVDSPLHPKNQLFSAMPKGGEGDVLTTMNNSMIPKIEEIFSYSDSVIDESVQDDISNDIAARFIVENTEHLEQIQSQEKIEESNNSWNPSISCDSSDIEIKTKVKTAYYSVSEDSRMITAVFDIYVEKILIKTNKHISYNIPLVITGLPVNSVKDVDGIVGGLTVYYHAFVRNHCTNISGTVSGGESNTITLWRNRVNSSALNHLLLSDITNITKISGVVQYFC